MFGLLNCQGLCWLNMASGWSPNTAAKFAHRIYPSLDLMLLHDNTIASTSPPWPPCLLGNITASWNQSLERESGELQTSELYIASSELRPKRSPARHVFRCFTLGPYVIALSVPLQRCNGEEQPMANAILRPQREANTADRNAVRASRWGLRYVTVSQS